MEKKNLIVLQHEDKTSKGNPPKDYTRFKCRFEDGSEKWMSAFESDVIKDLKNHENKLISVSIAQTGDFWNIRKFHGISEHSVENQMQAQADKVAEAGNAAAESINKTPIKPEEFGKKAKPFEKDPIGLAVDLVVSGKTTEEAIKAVREIQEAFP